MTAQTTERELVTTAEVGKRLHMLMWERRISQAKAGAAIGVKSQTLGKKLRGSVPLTVDEMVRLAELLEVSPADLLPRLDSNQQPSGYATRAGVCRTCGCSLGQGVHGLCKRCQRAPGYPTRERHLELIRGAA